MNDPRNTPPTSQTEGGGGALDDANVEWSRLAREAYDNSTSYVDSNYRKTWDDSIRAFNSQHPQDSKYNQPAYEKRSRLYRPKTRSVIRKNEAAAAAAFFSNMDLTDVQATDQSDRMKVAGADVMKQLLQYRLTKSIPWYQILLGGLQDAQTVGVACAHIYWDYKAKPKVKAVGITPEDTKPEDSEYPKQSVLPDGAFSVEDDDQGEAVAQEIPVKVDAVVEEKPLVDKPVIDLIPVENLRIDPGASWTDPIRSSPYVIHLMPMYVMDVKERMESGEWQAFPDRLLRSAGDTSSDSTRMARQKDRQDPYGSDTRSLLDYEICWVQRHIHRRDGEDWEFYCLKDGLLLSEPRLLKETVLHGERPYVMGGCIIETHKIYPGSVATIGKNLQEEANEVANQRIDNVKFVLNKKWFVKRGAEVDIGGLVRNVPGGIVMANDPDKDIKEVSWPDVTGSAYEEQSRIDGDMNELLGNFSAAQVMADHGINGPARNMALLGQSAGTLVEYLLKTFVETFAQPVLNHVVKLEQAYETDQVIMAIAAKKANVFQKYGVDQVTDDLLDQELTLTINVGMGATDPQMKLQKFMAAITAYMNILEKKVVGINMQEIGKEVFGYLGYADGTRFFTNENPQLLQLQQQIQQQAQIIQQLNMKVQEKQTAHQVKLAATKMTNETKLQETAIKEDGENKRAVVTHLRAIRESDHQRAHEIAMAQRQQVQQLTMGSAR